MRVRLEAAFKKGAAQHGLDQQIFAATAFSMHKRFVDHMATTAPVLTLGSMADPKSLLSWLAACSATAPSRDKCYLHTACVRRDSSMRLTVTASVYARYLPHPGLPLSPRDYMGQVATNLVTFAQTITKALWEKMFNKGTLSTSEGKVYVVFTALKHLNPDFPWAGTDSVRGFSWIAVNSTA